MTFDSDDLGATEEFLISAYSPMRIGNDTPRRGVDPYQGIESTLTALAKSPPHSAEAQALRERLMHRCLPSADHIARRYADRGESYGELFRAASRAVAVAIDRFDPARGTLFVAFAVPTVLGAVRERFREPACAEEIARRLRRTQATIGPTVDAMTHRLNRVPTALEIAAELDVDLMEVARALLAGHLRSA